MVNAPDHTSAHEAGGWKAVTFGVVRFAYLDAVTQFVETLRTDPYRIHPGWRENVLFSAIHLCSPS